MTRPDAVDASVLEKRQLAERAINRAMAGTPVPLDGGGKQGVIARESVEQAGQELMRAGLRDTGLWLSAACVAANTGHIERAQVVLEATGECFKAGGNRMGVKETEVVGRLIEGYALSREAAIAAGGQIVSLPEYSTSADLTTVSPVASHSAIDLSDLSL